MTELLYLKDSYLKEFDAKVIENGEGYVVLDKTAFYYQGGGQPSDTGTLNGIRVTKVKKENGKINHFVEENVSGTVHGIIDWAPRYKLMRYHTAAHLLSTIINEDTGAQITGNQLGLEKTRIDFDLKELNKEKISEWEEQTNKIINEGKEVSTYELPREKAFQIPGITKLRDVLPPSIKMIRIIDINGLDKQACGGTHVKNTSEIKGIKIIGTENKGKGRKRLYFELIE